MDSTPPAARTAERGPSPAAVLGVTAAVVLVALWYGAPLLRMGWDVYDDGLLLRRAAHFDEAAGPLDLVRRLLLVEQQEGRCRPVYWAYTYVQCRVFGSHPDAYRAAHWLLFAAACGLVSAVAMALARHAAAGLLAGLLGMAFGPFPVIGHSALFSWGRYGTPEVPVTVLALALFWLCWSGTPRRPWLRILRGAAILLLSLCLLGLKETTLPIVASCLLLPWLRDARRGRRLPRGWWDGLAWGLPAAVAMLAATRLVGSVGRTGYGGRWLVESPGTMLAIAVGYWGILLDSFGPLLLVAPLVLAVRTTAALTGRGEDSAPLRAMLGLALVGLGAAAPLCLWGQVYSRYLTPAVALWAPVLATGTVWCAEAAWRAWNPAPAARRSADLALAGALLLLGWAVPPVALAATAAAGIAWCWPAGRLRAEAGAVALALLAVALMGTGVAALRGRAQLVAIRIETHAATHNAFLEALAARRPPAVYFDVPEQMELVGNTKDLLHYAYNLRTPVDIIVPQSAVLPATGTLIVQNPNVSPQSGSLSHLPQTRSQRWERTDIERTAQFPHVATWRAFVYTWWQRGPGIAPPESWWQRLEMYNVYLIWERVY